MDFPDLVKTGMAVVGGLGTMLASLLLWRLRGEFAARGDLKTLVERVEAIESDNVELKVRIDQVPTHDDLSDLREKLGAIAGDVKALSATLSTALDGVREQLSMLVRHHLERA